MKVIKALIYATFIASMAISLADAKDYIKMCKQSETASSMEELRHNAAMCGKALDELSDRVDSLESEVRELKDKAN
jgi:polyhydroxyalkanoate synthesis regulator phasin